MKQKNEHNTTLHTELNIIKWAFTNMRKTKINKQKKNQKNLRRKVDKNGRCEITHGIWIPEENWRKKIKIISDFLKRRRN